MPAIGHQVAADFAESCDVCAREKGLKVEAKWDAPTLSGCWSFLCAACWYRLPAELKKMATRLTAAVLR